MSGIYIRGMKMPERCFDCDLCYDMYRCRPLGVDYYETDGFDPSDERLPNCPLIPVPDHGRLIDGDKVFKRLQKQAMSVWGDGNPRYQIVLEVMDAIRFAPTILPAEEGEG